MSFTQVEHLRQYRDPQQIYWGIAHPYRLTIDSWLRYHNLTYVPFYTSFLNWTIKVASRCRQTVEPTARPAEVRIRNDLRSGTFNNPFELIEIMDYFRKNIYGGRAMRGWIKDHEDDKQWKSAMRQLWHLLYDRPRSARERRGTAREGDQMEIAEKEDDEEESGGVHVESNEEHCEEGLGGSPATSMGPEPVSP